MRPIRMSCGISPDDLLLGGTGADVLDGGAGNDTADYNYSLAAVTVDLSNTANNTGEAAGDSYIGIEQIWGSIGFGDTLIGDAGDNYLRGFGGDDVLEGGVGADTLVGNGGSDTASYASAAAGLTANLNNSAGNTGEAMKDYSIIKSRFS